MGLDESGAGGRGRRADCGPRKDTRRPAEATLDGDGRTFAQIADDRMPQEEAPSTCADDRTTSSVEKIAFARRLTELRRVEWVVYAKRPFAGPDALLAYLGRFTHRVAISNTRLIALADGRVSFRWRDYRHHNKSKVMTLAADEFIRRFLLHALPDGFHRIRHYGFLANRHRADKLALCRRLLAAPAPAPIADDNDCSDSARNQCPCCGGQMEPIGPFPRSSPVSRSAWRDSS
jgi:hypothetical protein